MNNYEGRKGRKYVILPLLPTKSSRKL